jgi:hypothetical protein
MKTFLLALLLSSPAIAQETPPCYPINEVVEFLFSRYGETMTYTGVSDQQFITTWINPVTKTFTITTSTADGNTCLVVSGHEWQEAVQPPNL